jgi:hypothetical protein
MRSRPRHSVFAVVVTLALVTSAPSLSHADEKDAPVATTSTESDGYGYRFKDDAMQAGGLSPTDPRLRVVRHSARSVLLRLRTQFIPEMLKSVENL